MSREAAATRAGLGALVRHARATRRLPTAARAALAHHALSPALPAPAALHRLVGALAGRLTVVNHPPAAALPHAARGLVRGLAWTALYGDAADAQAHTAEPPHGVLPPGDGRATREQALVRAWRARRALAGDDTAWLARGDSRWVGAALYEEDPLAVRGSADEHPRAAGGEPALPGFTVALRYHMVVFAGAGDTPPAWDVLDAAAARAAPAGDPPRPWFAGRLLVPDAWATARMTPEVRAAWAAVTGRAGAADRYWYPESWLRFLEPGRMVGCVSAAEVARSRPGRVRGAEDVSDRAPRAAWEPGGGPDAPYAATSPRLERGICVPPAYCLVDCAGALGITVARV